MNSTAGDGEVQDQYVTPGSLVHTGFSKVTKQAGKVST